MSRMLKIEDLMSLLGVSRSTFFRLRKENKFPAPTLRVGKFDRWDPRDVEAWVEQQRTAQG